MAATTSFFKEKTIILPAKSVIFADFDNTQAETKNQKIVCDSENLRSILAWRHLAETGVIEVVHCTGRVIADITRDIESGDYSGLDFPVAARTKTIIAGVGTEIYNSDENGGYVPDSGWTEKIDNSGFQGLTEKFTQNGVVQEELLKRVEEILGVQFDLAAQEPEKNTDYKKSLWAKPHDSVHNENLEDALKQALRESGVNPDQLTLTISIQTNRIAIDITPTIEMNGQALPVNKETACLYVMDRDNIAPEKACVAGDSGNDSHCFAVESAKTILPGNAQQDLVNAVKAAKDPEDIFHADSDQKVASGLLQACVQADIITDAQLTAAYKHADSVLEDVGPTPTPL